MNKIKLVDNKEKQIITIDNLDDREIYIENQNNNLEINIKDNIDNNIFILIKESSLNLIFNIESKSNIEINIFSLNSTIKNTINFKKEESKVICKYSSINTSSNKYDLTINHITKNTISSIYNHGINLGDELSFIINGNIISSATNVKCNQDSQIITFKNNYSKIIPNFIIRNNDVIANHASYIGNFKKSDLFYLKTRGLSEIQALKLLVKAFLIGKMNLTYSQIEDILNIINNYWR